MSDEEWAFVAPYLTLMKEDAPQQDHPVREVFNGLRWVVRTGAEWRMMPPHDLPPWPTVYQQLCRWVGKGSSAWLAHFRRLANTLAGFHFLAFAIVLLARFVALMTQDAYQALAMRARDAIIRVASLAGPAWSAGMSGAGSA